MGVHMGDRWKSGPTRLPASTPDCVAPPPHDGVMTGFTMWLFITDTYLRPRQTRQRGMQCCTCCTVEVHGSNENTYLHQS